MDTVLFAVSGTDLLLGDATSKPNRQQKHERISNCCASTAEAGRRGRRSVTQVDVKLAWKRHACLPHLLGN